jgi:cytochrome b561
MTLKNTNERWGAISQTLHWLVVLLIFGIGIVGLVMGDLPKTPKYFWVYTAHKSLGITVLALMLLRLLWRWYAGSPALLPNTPRWQARTATLTHGLLYAFALFMPLSGWLYDSAAGLRPFRLFGQFTMPKLLAPNETLKSILHALHEWGFWLLIALVLLHAAAAFYHHLFQQDATLTRMLPRCKRNPSP